MRSRGPGADARWARTGSWEDPRLLRALAPQDRDVVVFEASGDDALVLLAAGAATVRVVVPDVSAAALVELKIAAASSLPPQSVASLLGCGDFGRRVWFYHYVRPLLADPVRAFWDAHEHAVREGIASAGDLERSAARIGRVVRLALGGPCIAALEQAADAAARHAIVTRRASGARWLVATLALRQLAATAGAPADGAAERLTSVLARQPLDDSPFALRLLRNAAPPAPEWASAGALAQLSSAVARVQVTVGSRAAWLSSCREPDLVLALGRAPTDRAEQAALAALVGRGGRALGWGPAPGPVTAPDVEDRGIFPGEPWVYGVGAA